MNKIDISIKKTINFAIKNSVTLLGIGPMSRNIMEVAIEVGKEYNCPVIFIASRNQVDSDEFGSGYVCGWNQSRFVRDVKAYKKKIGSKNPVYICRDHGGEWQRDEEKLAKIPFDNAVKNSNLSFIEDLKAGFDLIHVDPTKDPIKGKVSLEDVIIRAVERIEYIEKIRNELKLPEIAYEIGTEENDGRVIIEKDFGNLMISIIERLKAKKLPEPSFIVGQTGTLVKMDYNAGVFKINSAKKLINIASKYGIGFKQHNTDYLSETILAVHPQIGVNAANVAPEFGVIETRALMDLAGRIGDKDFINLIGKYVLNGNKWQKWLDERNKNISMGDLLKNTRLRERIININAHYYFNETGIIEARNKLYKELEMKGVSAPNEIVKTEIKKSILKYVKAFNLINSSARIKKS